MKYISMKVDSIVTLQW